MRNLKFKKCLVTHQLHKVKTSHFPQEVVQVSSCFFSASHLRHCFKPNCSIWFCLFLEPTSLTDLGFASTKGLLSKGCHHIVRKGISLIRGNGVRANQKPAPYCFCYSLHHNPNFCRQSIFFSPYALLGKHGANSTFIHPKMIIRKKQLHTKFACL